MDFRLNIFQLSEMLIVKSVSMTGGQIGDLICFSDEDLSKASVEEWELTRCIEDMYKVRTTIYQTECIWDSRIIAHLIFVF